MDLISRARPVDRLVSAYSLGFAVLWLGAPGRAAFIPAVVCAHVAAAVLPSVLARRHAAGRPVSRALHELYPLFFVVLVWIEMGLVREFLHATAHDPVIAAADRVLFGRHLHAVWMPAMPHAWFSELMFLIYLAYYPLVFLTPVVLLLLGRRQALRGVMLGLAVAYLGCYALYAVFPVDGPSHTMARYAGPLTEGLFYRIATEAVHAGDSLGTAFPSSHVAGAVTMAILASRWLSRPVAWLFGLEAAGVVLATVYTQNHFAVDALAGILLAALLQLVAVPLLSASLAGRPIRIPVPPLPVYASSASAIASPWR